jgi:sulfatase maturation enzyme AslB (radical SAM superfamily)
MLNTPARAITMEFQGGEPLLNFPLIKFMVEYSEARNRDLGKNIDRVITTNLSRATPEILGYCRDHGIALSTSLDGPEWLHTRTGRDQVATATRR